MVSCQGDFSTKSLRDFALRAPLEMTYGGNVQTVQNSSTLPMQPVGACIASPLCRRCFPVRMSIGAKSLMQQTRTRNVRPYAVEENGDKKTSFPLPSQLPIDEYFSRNADVTNTPDVKYAS